MQCIPSIYIMEIDRENYQLGYWTHTRERLQDSFNLCGWKIHYLVHFQEHPGALTIIKNMCKLYGCDNINSLIICRNLNDIKNQLTKELTKAEQMNFCHTCGDYVHSIKQQSLVRTYCSHC